MTIPLIILAGLSVVGGLLNTPFALRLERFLEPSFEYVTLQNPPEGLAMFAVLAGLSVMAGLVGGGFGYVSYNRPKQRWLDFEDGFEPLWGTWEQAYRVDDLYGAAIVAPGKKAAEVAAFGVDLAIIDGAVNGVGSAVRRLGELARSLQTGYVRNYGVLFLGGALVIVIWLVVGR